MARYPIFRIKDIVDIAQQRQRNKLDCVIAWVGKRGSGKSTGNYRFCRKLGRYTVNHLGTDFKAGGFRPERDMVYARQDIIDLLKNRKFKPVMADEMINVAYNREFHSADQQFLIKVLNQYRSNYNIFSMCNPFFYDLDPDLRSLVSIRIDIIRRGMGIVHFPCDNVYSNDIWDTKKNAQIEMSWSRSKNQKSRYSKLTTFQGILLYPALPKKIELKYEEIRDRKRNLANNGVGDGDSGIANFYDRLLNLIDEGKIDRESFENFCYANNLKVPVAIKGLNKRLLEKNIPMTFIGYLKKKATEQKLKNDEIEAMNHTNEFGHRETFVD
jgi:hypothetical protein